MAKQKSKSSARRVAERARKAPVVSSGNGKTTEPIHKSVLRLMNQASAADDLESLGTLALYMRRLVLAAATRAEHQTRSSDAETWRRRRD